MRSVLMQLSVKGRADDSPLLAQNNEDDY